jgi:hypothetical protein
VISNSTVACRPAILAAVRGQKGLSNNMGEERWINPGAAGHPLLSASGEASSGSDASGRSPVSQARSTMQSVQKLALGSLPPTIGSAGTTGTPWQAKHSSTAAVATWPLTTARSGACSEQEGSE